jgi:hypothetical protein
MYVHGSMYHQPVTTKTGLSFAPDLQHSSRKYAHADVSLLCSSLTHETSSLVGLKVRGIEYEF